MKENRMKIIIYKFNIPRRERLKVWEHDSHPTAQQATGLPLCGLGCRQDSHSTHSRQGTPFAVVGVETQQPQPFRSFPSGLRL